MTNLWSSNHPHLFWQCQPNPPPEAWRDAIAGALPLLELPSCQPDADQILALTLGEERFGPRHWTLSFPKQAYYFLKPLLPRPFTRLLRKIYRRNQTDAPEIRWPVDARYVSFLWKVLENIKEAFPGLPIVPKPLWPADLSYAFVLTHDVETASGLSFVRDVANLEEELGFRSMFNFVMEDYPLDLELIKDLRQRGFEVGSHGLKHDGKLFISQKSFEREVPRLNRRLRELDVNGFRSPLTHRNPHWMQLLDIQYDLSFFDTDPFEPIPGGTLSIWPFFLGHFVELPYTLVQDYTLTKILGETTPRLWLEKVDFIEANRGMALVNSHPDYLRETACMDVYRTFLLAMRERREYWHALPREVASWWRMRAFDQPNA